MATTTTNLITLEEYLHTVYRPDCDFVDDHIEERTLGEFDHGRLQALLTMWFGAHEKDWNVRVVVELRTRVSLTRVRIPDVCLLRRDAPREPVTLTPPLLCIEVLSPEDRLPRVLKVLDDYVKMGVPNLWIIDPVERIAYIYKDSTLKLVSDRLTIPDTEIYVDLPTLFAQLD
jgi:Uma2 family endonuclease